MDRLAALACALSLAACAGDVRSDDTVDAGGATELTLRVENIALFDVLKASATRTKVGGGDGHLAPGEAYELRFTAGIGHHVTFASMLVESNDWFFAPVSEGIPLYANGEPVSGDVTSYVRLWDAGTELDQEPAVGDATGVNQPTRTTGAPDPDPRVRLVDAAGPRVASMIRVTLTPGADRTFTLRIENVSTSSTLVTSQGARAVTIGPVAWAVHTLAAPLFIEGYPARANGLEELAEAGNADAMSTALRLQRGTAGPLSRGIVVVHRDAAPLFTAGEADRGEGLEALVEDGDEASVMTMDGALALATPLGGTDPAPLVAGQAYEVTFTAAPGDRVSFATGLASANDWFFAPSPDGIELFHGPFPRWGDVTSDVRLFDLGTELDEELEVGPNTGTQQPAPGMGRPDRVTTVREVTLDRYESPLARQVRVTLMPGVPE